MFQYLSISQHVSVLRHLRGNEPVYDIFVATENGTTYNTYIISSDAGYALVDPGRMRDAEAMVEALKTHIDCSQLTHVIITQSQPSHAEALQYLLKEFPDLIVVGTPGAMTFLKHVTNSLFKNFEARPNQPLSLGSLTVRFSLAPNLPWPDAMLALVEPDQVLLSGGVFSAHYCSEEVFTEEVKEPERYQHAFYEQYYWIFHPHHSFVHKAITQIAEWEVAMVAPAFGPINRIAPRQPIDDYLNWSAPEEKDENKVAIVYVSAHGYTEHIAQVISKHLSAAGYTPRLVNLTQEDTKTALKEINTSGAFLIGSPTIACDAVPPVWDLLTRLLCYDCEHKFCAAFGSFGWTGEAVKHIEARLGQLKADVFRPGLRIKLNPDSSEKQEEIDNFAEGFTQKLLTRKQQPKSFPTTKKTGYWQCLICGEITEGEDHEDPCPFCRSPGVHTVPYELPSVEFSSDSKERIVIIGSGVAAVSAAEAIRARNKQCSVEIISAEDTPPYYRILLSKRLHCQNAFTHIREQEWFDSEQITLTLNTPVSGIDTKKREVITENGGRKTFDRLIIATGARSRQIPIHGDSKQGVFDLRGQHDFEAIRDYANQDCVEDVTIVGGGILALEAAQSLSTLGKRVTIVECAPRIMYKQLDADASKILTHHIQQQGVSIYTNEMAEEIFGTGEDLNTTCSIKLSHSGVTLKTEMVLRMTGICMNTEIVKDTEIKTNKGILVDDHMETSVSGIYAIGDVAEWNQSLGGVWLVAREQGRIAGAHAVGDTSVSYQPLPVAYNYSGFNFELFSIGDVGNRADMHYQILELADQEREIYRRLYFHKHQFVGGILLGDTSKAPYLRKAIMKGSTMQDLLEQHYLDE